MSAQEIIERIKVLPPEELEEVRSFLRNASLEIPKPNERRVRYASDEQAASAGSAIVKEFPETFRRLAQ